MPTAYIYRGTFQVRSGETLRYIEVTADGTLAPEVTKTYEELAGIGSLSVPAVSLTPSVSAPSLSGGQIGAIVASPVSLQPVVSPAGMSGVQVGSVAAAPVSLQPTVAVPSLAGVQVGSIGTAAVSLQPAVAVGSLTGVEVASAPTPTPTISATGGNTTVSIALTNSVSGATSWSINWGTSAGSRTNTIDWATIQAATPTFPAAPFVHTGRTNGTTYYYSLVAVNGSGSTESAEVSAAAVTVETYTLTPSYDAEIYAESIVDVYSELGTLQSASANNATIGVDTIDDGEGGITYHLSRFAMSFNLASLAGKTITSAKLRITALGTGSGAGVSSFEGTWTTTPSMSSFTGASLGSGAFSGTTTCEITMSLAYLQSVVGSTAKLMLRETSLDVTQQTGVATVGIKTAEDATAGNRPTLILEAV